MRFWISRAIAAVGAAMLTPTSGQASEGLIAFTGAVTENSCSIQVNGADAGDGTIVLPIVEAAALDHSSALKDEAAGTFFHISLSACAAGNAGISGSPPTLVTIYFEAGQNVDPATNALINMGTSNVEVKIFQASETALVGAQITPGISGAGQAESRPMAGPGTQYFYAAYSAPGNGGATAGTVSTLITYSLIYQ